MSGVKSVLCECIVLYLFAVVCVHIRGVSVFQGSGLEGLYCTTVIYI